MPKTFNFLIRKTSPYFTLLTPGYKKNKTYEDGTSKSNPYLSDNYKNIEYNFNVFLEKRI